MFPHTRLFQFLISLALWSPCKLSLSLYSLPIISMIGVLFFFLSFCLCYWVKEKWEQVIILSFDCWFSCLPKGVFKFIILFVLVISFSHVYRSLNWVKIWKSKVLLTYVDLAISNLKKNNCPKLSCSAGGCVGPLGCITILFLRHSLLACLNAWLHEGWGFVASEKFTDNCSPPNYIDWYAFLYVFIFIIWSLFLI